MFIDAQTFKELMHYDPETGVFTWRVNRGNQKTKGRVFGTVNRKGYLVGTLSYNGSYNQYLLHRLAFLYMEGHFPQKHVDHINRDKTDNRWANLRHSDEALNNRNQGQRHAGVTWNPQVGKWRAREPGNKASAHFVTHLAASYQRHCFEQEER